jgi:hypothetical protein
MRPRSDANGAIATIIFDRSSAQAAA